MRDREIVRDDLRSRFPIESEASLKPDPAEVRSYVNNGLKTGWSEDYPIAARWLSQFADLLDALASQVGEKPICGDSQHRHIGACELYTSQVGESE